MCGLYKPQICVGCTNHKFSGFAIFALFFSGLDIFTGLLFANIFNLHSALEAREYVLRPIPSKWKIIIVKPE
jgi:hypothetical protein